MISPLACACIAVPGPVDGLEMRFRGPRVVERGEAREAASPQAAELTETSSTVCFPRTDHLRSTYYNTTIRRAPPRRGRRPPSDWPSSLIKITKNKPKTF